MGIELTDIYWAAGFLEGEGSFQNLSSPRVSCAQVQKEPLDRLVKIFGGKMYLTHSKRENEQDCWHWDLNVVMSVQVMMTLYVLMSPKRKQQIEFSINKWKRARARIQDNATHCQNGHEFTTENTRFYKRAELKDPNAKGFRICRTCDNERTARRSGGARKPPSKEIIFVQDVDINDLGL